ncbi:MAG: LytTR family transcriptional regulator [Pedobacter sp.]|nr:MAG: LytTR family transcriptional regulator [Pedobacter sp.]
MRLPQLLNSESHRITHLVAETNYTTIFFEDASRLLVSRTLSYCTEHLPGFMRIHRGCAINLTYVYEVRTEGVPFVVLMGGETLAISRRRLFGVVKRVEKH